MTAGRIWLVALALIAAVPTAAHAAPTSVTILRGEVHSGPTRLLVSNEVIKGKLEFLVLRFDDVADDEVYPLRLVRGGCAGAAKARPLLSVRVRNGKVVRGQRRLAPRKLRRPLSWYAPDEDSGAGGMCARMGPAAPGAIISPRDAQSGLPTGVVAVQRRAGRLRISSLFTGVNDGSLLGFTTEPCGQPYYDQLLPAWLKSGNEVAIETLELSSVRPRTWRAFVVLPAGDGPQPALACVKWVLSELDA